MLIATCNWILAISTILTHTVPSCYTVPHVVLWCVCAHPYTYLVTYVRCVLVDGVDVVCVVAESSTGSVSGGIVEPANSKYK